MMLLSFLLLSKRNQKIAKQWSLDLSHFTPTVMEPSVNYPVSTVHFFFCRSFSQKLHTTETCQRGKIFVFKSQIVRRINNRIFAG